MFFCVAGKDVLLDSYVLQRIRCTVGKIVHKLKKP